MENNFLRFLFFSVPILITTTLHQFKEKKKISIRNIKLNRANIILLFIECGPKKYLKRSRTHLVFYYSFVRGVPQINQGNA